MILNMIPITVLVRVNSVNLLIGQILSDVLERVIVGFNMYRMITKTSSPQIYRQIIQIPTGISS